MSRRRFIFGALVAFALILAPASVSAIESPVDVYLEEWQRSNAIPGVAVAVLDETETSTWLLGRDGHGDPITSGTPFLIGSVAKTVTSTMVLQLIDEGLVGLDDAAQTQLPWLDHDASVRQLLDHTAGYSAQDGLAVSERYRADLTVTDAARALDHSGQIGEYSYSSAGYLALGALIEQVTGNSFGEEMRHRITDPARMEGSGVDGAIPTLPPGHRLWWGQPTAYDPGPEPSGAPYGYLVSTLDDLEAYSRAQLDGAMIPDELRAVAWSDQTGMGGGQGYGFGWRINAGDGTLRVHHTGATPGYFAHVMLMPEEDRAVIVLANGYSEARAPSLTVAAADIDRLSQGGTASPEPGDTVLTLLPWLMLVPVALAVLTLVGVRLRRPKRRTATVILTLGSVFVAGLLALVPTLMDMTWHIVRIWTPDGALGLMMGIAAWVIVAILLTVTGRRSRTRAARLHRSTP